MRFTEYSRNEDIFIEEMKGLNEEGFTHDIILSYKDRKVTLTFPANNISLSDIFEIMQDSFFNEYYLGEVREIRQRFSSLGVVEAEFIHQNHKVWIEKLSTVMSKVEMSNYFMHDL